jgi:FtsZ-binding cell division protein ZapB
MEAMQEQIQRIEGKVQQLLKEYNLAQKEIQRLQKENNRLTEQLHSQTELGHQLQQKVDSLKVTASGLSDNTKKDLEKRINTYLKDIDKCLALLHS